MPNGVLEPCAVPLPAAAAPNALTETAVLEDPVTAIAILERLRARGFRVSIDDFGVGQMSLRHLVDMPVDCIKIDRVFTRELVHSDAHVALVGGVVRVAHDLGLRVIIEGVESAEDARRAMLAGCRYGQGFHFGRSVDVRSLIVRVAAERTMSSALSNPWADSDNLPWL